MAFGLPASRAGGYWCARPHLLIIALLFFVVASRWALAPRHLYYFDSANFALALEHFNPAEHRPQPPGYPLFVALTKVIHLWVGPPQQVFLIAGLLAACAATILIRALAAELFGATAGLLSAVLLASNPVFWFGGITNQIRIFLALGAISVALLAWRALSRPDQPAWFYATCATLGMAAGFRPELALVLAPLVLWTWYRTGRSLPRLAFGVGGFLATALPWMIVIVFVVGGPKRFLAMVWGYSTVQFEGSSALFGASALSAWRMFTSALVWHLLGAVAWIWALPVMMRRFREAVTRDQAIFLLLGIVPPFLFSAILHIGDPDQGLAGISILCVVGGAVLAMATRTLTDRKVLALCALVTSVQALIFFAPPGRIARASSYRAAAAVERMNDGAISAIQSLTNNGPITIVHYGSSVASRHLVYYFPEDYVVVLPGEPRHPAPGEPVELFYRHRALPAAPGAAGFIRRGSRKVVFLLPWNATPEDLPGASRYGPVFYFNRSPGDTLAIGPFKLIPESVTALPHRASL